MPFPFENMPGPRSGGSRPAVPDSLARTRKLALAIKAQAAKERRVGLSPRENANRKPYIPVDRSFGMGEVNKPSGLATAARNLIADAERRAAGPVDMLAVLEQQTSGSSKKLRTEVMTQLLRDTESGLVEVPPSTIEKQAPQLFGAWRERMRFNIQDASREIGADPRLADVLRPMTNVFKKGGPGAAQAAQAYSDGLWKLMTRGYQEAPHEAELELAAKFGGGKPFALASVGRGPDILDEVKEPPKKVEMDAMGHMNEDLPPLVKSVRKTRKGTSVVERIRMPHPKDVESGAFRAKNLDRDREETDSGLRIMFKGKVPLPEKDQPRVAGELLQGLNSAQEAAFLERVRAEQVVGKKGMSAALKRMRPEMGRKAQRLLDAKEGRKALLVGEEMGVGRDLLREVVSDRKVARELMGNLIGLEHLAKYGRAGASALGKSGRGAKILELLKLGQRVL